MPQRRRDTPWPIRKQQGWLPRCRSRRSGSDPASPPPRWMERGPLSTALRWRGCGGRAVCRRQRCTAEADGGQVCASSTSVHTAVLRQARPRWPGSVVALTPGRARPPPPPFLWTGSRPLLHGRQIPGHRRPRVQTLVPRLGLPQPAQHTVLRAALGADEACLWTCPGRSGLGAGGREETCSAGADQPAVAHRIPSRRCTQIRYIAPCEQESRSGRVRSAVARGKPCRHRPPPP